MEKVCALIHQLETLNQADLKLFNQPFLRTWDKTATEIEAVMLVNQVRCLCESFWYSY